MLVRGLWVHLAMPLLSMCQQVHFNNIFIYKNVQIMKKTDSVLNTQRPNYTTLENKHTQIRKMPLNLITKSKHNNVIRISI